MFTCSGDYLMHSLIKLIVFMMIPTTVFSTDEIMIGENTIRKTTQDEIIIDLSTPNNLINDLISEAHSPIFRTSEEFSSKQTSPSNDKDLGGIPLRIKTLEDVENAGCSVQCLQATRGFWTISTGIFDFFGGIGNPTKAALVTISTLGNYSNEVRKIMGITTTLVSAGTLTFNMLARLGYKRATEAQKELGEIEQKIEAILDKYNKKTPKSLEKATLGEDALFEKYHITEGFSPESPTGIKLKMSPNKLPLNKNARKKAKKELEVDKLKLEKLQKRYSELTELSEYEKSYFSFSNCFLRNIHSTAGIVEILCNIGNLVMIPLSTIPVWDPVTATALGIVTVCIEGGSIFSSQMARQSELINQSVVDLESDLEEFNV